MSRSNIRYWGHIDRDPDQTKRKVLVALAASSVPMTRRAVQGVVFGDMFGASQATAAIRWLEDCHLVERAYNPRFGTGRGKWQITDAGRLTLDWLAATEKIA